MGFEENLPAGLHVPKVDVNATGLISETAVQLNIFSDFKGVKYDKVSRVLDELNLHYGAGTLQMASEGKDQKWSMKRKFLRPHYTTNWNDIIKLNKYLSSETDEKS